MQSKGFHPEALAVESLQQAIKDYLVSLLAKGHRLEFTIRTNNDTNAGKYVSIPRRYAQTASRDNLIGTIIKTLEITTRTHDDTHAEKYVLIPGRCAQTASRDNLIETNIKNMIFATPTHSDTHAMQSLPGCGYCELIKQNYTRKLEIAE